tara:strand:+ start:180 stop:635 length:456 start_codon:yes stop_codon:yes gene_type:complete
MDYERSKFYQAGDGSYFYSADDAQKWDLLDKMGQLNLLHVLKKEWAPEESSQSKLRKVLQEINIDEFEDFMADILGICESFEEMVYEFEGNINLNPEYLKRVYPEEKESLEKLKKQIKDHREWKEKHQASYSFLTRKLIEKKEKEDNENDI